MCARSYFLSFFWQAILYLLSIRFAFFFRFCQCFLRFRRFLLDKAWTGRRRIGNLLSSLPLVAWNHRPGSEIGICQSCPGGRNELPVNRGRGRGRNERRYRAFPSRLLIPHCRTPRDARKHARRATPLGPDKNVKPPSRFFASFSLPSAPLPPFPKQLAFPNFFNLPHLLEFTASARYRLFQLCSCSRRMFIVMETSYLA